MSRRQHSWPLNRWDVWEPTTQPSPSSISSGVQGLGGPMAAQFHVCTTAPALRRNQADHIFFTQERTSQILVGWPRVECFWCISFIERNVLLKVHFLEPSPSPVLHYPCLDAYSHGQATNSVICAGTHTLSVTLLCSRVIPHSAGIWPALCRTGQEMLITLAHLSRQVPSATLTQNKQPIPPPKNMEPKLKKNIPPFLGFRIHPFFSPSCCAARSQIGTADSGSHAGARAGSGRTPALHGEIHGDWGILLHPGGFGLMALFLLQGRPLKDSYKIL